MKTRRLFLMLFVLFISICTLQAQHHVALPHGMVIGSRPDTANSIAPVQLQSFMGDKKRITTVLKAKIVKVLHEKGGWFNLDAGNKQIIAAHFKNYNVILPTQITGRTVLISAVAEKQFLADDQQHFAGDTTNYKTGKAAAGLKITLEVKGIMVYQ